MNSRYLITLAVMATLPAAVAAQSAPLSSGAALTPHQHERK
jgi:hypothetical protein